MNEVNETLSKYIDADKACLQCIAHHMCNEENCIIAQQPAADVVEVKCGHWIGVHAIEMYGGDPNDWNSYAECAVVCSECGNDFELDAHEYTYCPHCGARMDGESDGG